MLLLFWFHFLWISLQSLFSKHANDIAELVKNSQKRANVIKVWPLTSQFPSYFSDLYFCWLGWDIYGNRKRRRLHESQWWTRFAWRLRDVLSWCRVHYNIFSIQLSGHCQHVYCSHLGKLHSGISEFQIPNNYFLLSWLVRHVKTPILTLQIMNLFHEIYCLFWYAQETWLSYFFQNKLLFIVSISEFRIPNAVNSEFRKDLFRNRLPLIFRIWNLKFRFPDSGFPTPNFRLV